MSSTVRKIQSEDEVKRWYEAGRTASWMAAEYLRKYNLEVSPHTFSSLISRRGWKSKLVRDTGLIPWRLRPEHRFLSEPQALRALARKRAGKPITDRQERQIANLLEDLELNNAVVHYDPELPEPFVLVPREPRDGDSPVRRPPKDLETKRIPTR